MRRIIVVLTLCASATPLLAAGLEANQAKFDQVINEKCVKCHTRDRIDEALKRGDDFPAILEKMLKFGVQLTDQDRDILGVFSGKPLK